MKYYISKYLNVVDTKYGSVLFSGVNGAIDEVSQEIGEAFKKGRLEYLDKVLSESDKSHMINRGYLTRLDAAQEEAAFIKFAKVLRDNCNKRNDSGTIMFLLSYDCNLNCAYCYQKEHRHNHKNIAMGEDLIERIFKSLYDKIIPGLKREKLRIMFYGGEPFLNGNRKAIDKILYYAKIYGLRASAITNATFESNMIDIFGEANGMVNRCQVSIDGAKRLHDKSRIPINGRPTFDKIVKNIKLMIEKGVKVSLRLNLDRKKLESVQELMRELKFAGILGHKNISIYASPLHDNIAKVDATDFMDLSELSQKLFKSGIDLEHPVSGRANEMNLLLNLKKGLGLNRTDFCMQSSQRTIVVDPYGDLYSCFEEAGYPEYRIGRINGESVDFFPLKDRYANRYVGNIEGCSKCSVALACGGQCAIKCRIKTGDIYKSYCENMKEVILEALKVSYEKYRETGNIRAIESISSHD